MNWYKMLKLAFNRTKSQNLTTSLSRQIFYFVKNNLGESDGTTLRVDNQCNLFLRVDLVGDVDLFSKNFYIESFGNFSKTKLFPPSIHFNINLNKSFSALDFPKLYYNLYDAVRHELRHYWQYLDPNYVLEDGSAIYSNDLLTRYDDFRYHILSSQEIDPYISGLVFSAQKQRKPFSELLDQSLDELLFENKPSTKQDVISSVIGKEVVKIMLDIKNRVMSRAKQIYPDTKLL